MTSRAAYRAWDTMRERDERVTQNLAPDLLPLWHRIKASIRGETPHARTEASLHYCHENPSEALSALQDQADASVLAMLASTRPDHVKRARLEAGRKAAETRAKGRVGKARQKAT